MDIRKIKKNYFILADKALRNSKVIFVVGGPGSGKVGLFIQIKIN